MTITTIIWTNILFLIRLKLINNGIGYISNKINSIKDLVLLY